MSDNQILMTQAQYARHRNKSPQYIGKLYKAGVLVMRGRLVDVSATDAVLDDKPAERTVPDGQQPPTSYAQERRWFSSLLQTTPNSATGKRRVDEFES